MSHGLKIGIGAIALAATLLACADDEAPPRRREAPSTLERDEGAVPPRPAYEVIDTNNAGSIAGNVRWVGPPPEPVMLPVRAHQDVCGDEQPSPALRVSARGGVADTVLWLADVRRGAPLEIPTEPPVIALQGCRFVPHVLAVGVGTTIAFRSDDPVLHNVHAFTGHETLWDFGLPTRGHIERRTIEAPGIIRLLSDVHSFMQGWVQAFEHPYFAVTDAQGRFRISNVPPGQYVMWVWHEGFLIVGTQAGRPQYSHPILLSRTLSVSERQETTIDFELSRESAEIAGGQ